MLNPQSPVPLYYQLADILLAKIRSGEYPPGERIPSEHQLAAAYGIGRPTARQATDLLVRKRILMRRRGSGTFVRQATKEVNLFSLAGTTAAFHQEGISVTTTLLEGPRLGIAPAGDEANPFAGKPAYFISRLRTVAKCPVLIEDIYLDSTTFRDIDRMDLRHQSLSRIVEEHYFLRPTGGKQQFRIDYVQGQHAAALEVAAATPILLVNRTINFSDKENAVYAAMYCRTDQFVFSQTIGGFTDA